MSLGKRLFPLLAAGCLGTMLGCSPTEPAIPTEPSQTEPSSEVESIIGDEAPAPTSLERPSPVSLDKEDCGQYGTQQDMNQCAGRNYKISDRELNRVYETLQESLGSPGQQKLAEAEERWLAFRDGQCQLESQRYEGGSIAPLIQSSCLERITDDRIAALTQTHQANQDYSVIDSQLNEVYQEVRQATLDETEEEALVDVQLAWLDYRDAHCSFETRFFPETTDSDSCLADVTEIRVWQLETLREAWSL